MTAFMLDGKLICNNCRVLWVCKDKETGAIIPFGRCQHYPRSTGKSYCVDKHGKKCLNLSRVYDKYVLCSATTTECSNGYACRDEEDSPPYYEAASTHDFSDELIDIYGGYPMRIEGEDTLFFDFDGTVMLCKNASQLMAQLRYNIDIIEMHTGPRFCTKEELFYFFLIVAQPWKSIEAYIEYRDKNKIPELDLGENDGRCVCSPKKVVSL